MDVTKPWDTLSDGEKELFARMAEVYAGFLAHADYHIGRLLDFLEFSGQRENTLVMLVSDNGASGEGGPNGSVNENRLFNGMPDDLESALAMIDELGGPKTYNHYANGWAMAFNTPFKMWKRYEFNGGTADPCILSWPAGMKARGEIREQYHHAIDLVPTVLDCLGVEAPQTIKGHVQSPFDGVSMRYGFDDAKAEGARKTQFYSMLGSRGIWHEGWKAVTTHPTIAGWSNFNDDTWELYHTDVDRSELHDLSKENPDKLRELQNLWFAEAGRNGAFPLDDRSPLEIILTPRPLLAPPRDRYTYFPDTAEVPEQQAVNVRNRSFAIGALVDIPAPGAEGVLFAQGARFGGHALYIKENRLHYVNSFAGIVEQKVDATQDLPTGEDLILSASFDKDGEDPPGVATGMLSLYYGDKKVGEGRIKTQPGYFSLAGEGLCVGRDSGEAVTDDYPGTSPHTLHRRHDQARRRGRQRRALPRPGAPGAGDARPGVTELAALRAHAIRLTGAPVRAAHRGGPYWSWGPSHGGSEAGSPGCLPTPSHQHMYADRRHPHPEDEDDGLEEADAEDEHGRGGEAAEHRPARPPRSPDDRGRRQREDARRLGRIDEEERVADRTREADRRHVGGHSHPEATTGHETADDGGGREQHGDEEQAAAEEDRGEELVLPLADPVADDTDEPEKGDPRERHEVQAHQRHRRA